jgi:hypothetical protein
MALQLGNDTPLAPLTITGGTNATPIVLTTSAPHGVAVASYGVVAGVTGLTAANGTWIVERVDATHLKLRGSVGNAAYTSGGTLTLGSTYTTVAEVRNIQDAGFVMEMVDVSAHDGQSGFGSSIPIIKRGKAMRVDINLVPLAATHDKLTGLLFVAFGGVSKPWLLIAPGTPHAICAFRGWVSDHGTNMPIGPLQSSVTIAIDGQMTWSLA